ncbi:hypothetical protein C5167_024250 [Papaver somniferum]|uniref:Uncharacterized protein n=1 Tax=Papaver somniferum TaxID=3469 RepID=A0A4Y7JN15_PAPSO|nr:hypothetical protein C5167_024250 [Papaver somniferum]
MSGCAQLNETCHQQFVFSLEMTFSSPNIPREIMTTWYVYFLKESLSFTVTASIISYRLALACYAHSRSLYIYKEIEFEGAWMAFLKTFKGHFPSNQALSI